MSNCARELSLLAVQMKQNHLECEDRAKHCGLHPYHNLHSSDKETLLLHTKMNFTTVAQGNKISGSNDFPEPNGLSQNGLSQNGYGKSLLPKSKIIAKPLEGCSKSHFSHIRNQVEKVTLDLHFGEVFGAKIFPRSNKWFRNRYKNRCDFSSDF